MLDHSLFFFLNDESVYIYILDTLYSYNITTNDKLHYKLLLKKNTGILLFLVEHNTIRYYEQ